MALSSTRSPSPLSSSSRPNPNSRTPEISNNVRRSFNSTPFASNSSRIFNSLTPLHRSADFGLRKSIGKEGLAATLDYEQKENEKDQNQKQERVRSALKGTKNNFMSPTISTASKIVATPRKKILAERNEPVRTSISLSGGKITPLTSSRLSDFEEENIDTNVDMGSRPKKQKTKSHTVTFDEKIESLPDPFLNFQSPSKIDNFLESSSSNFANFDVSSKPALAPLDADPLIPIYNPKTNSVSESTLNITIESDVANVFDLMSSKSKPSWCESTSIVRIESDVASVFDSSSKPCSSSPAIVPLDADPSLPPYEPETNFLSPRPQFLPYESNEETESNESSSVELALEEELLLPNPNSIDTHEANFVVEARLFRKLKSLSLILALVIACLLCMSITDTPSGLKDQSFPILYDPSKTVAYVLNLILNIRDQTLSYLSDPSEITEFAEVIFEVVARNVRLWSADFVSYFSKLLHNFGEVDKLVPVPFSSKDVVVLNHDEVEMVSDEKKWF